MSKTLCITFRFIQPFPLFHGCADGEIPEWPPSPMRAFQALLNAAAMRQRGLPLDPGVRSALSTLEGILPQFIAPEAHPAAVGYRTYVPHNQADLVTAAWDRGNLDASIASHRMEKDVHPMRIEFTDEALPAVYYLYPLGLPPDGCQQVLDSIRPSVRSITALGWGIDQVVADATLLDQQGMAALKGEPWRPGSGGGRHFRVHRTGSLDALLIRHQKFLNRIVNGSFSPVPPLTAFRVVGYRRGSDVPQRPFAVFALKQPNDPARNRAFGVARGTREVAGMLRHAVDFAAAENGWPLDRRNVFVHGKTPDGSHPASGVESPDRFSYVPLPTINHALGRVESIRRVLITAPPHCQAEINWARRALAGQALVDNQTQAETALLVPLHPSDGVLQQYVKSSEEWTTVTPVILGGYDDRNKDKAERLLWRALEQAGLAPDLLRQTQLEWRGVGYLPGVELASRVLPPRNLDNKPRYHVRLKFPHPVAGPLLIGGGRFRGFGLFVAMPRRSQD